MKTYSKIGSLILGLVVAGGLSGVAGAHAAPSARARHFNPQPDPPGLASVSLLHGVGHSVQLDFNPQPDPPGRHGVQS
jgi:hypothetical protein